MLYVIYYIIFYNIFYYVMQYYVISYHISCHHISYYIMLYVILYILSYHILLCHVMSCNIMIYRIISSYIIILYYVVRYILYCFILYYNLMGPLSYMRSVVDRKVVIRRMTVCSLWLEQVFRWVIQHTLPLVLLTEPFIPSLFILSHLTVVIWPSHVTNNTHNAYWDRTISLLLSFVTSLASNALILMSSVRILLASEKFFSRNWMLNSPTYDAWH